MSYPIYDPKKHGISINDTTSEPRRKLTRQADIPDGFFLVAHERTLWLKSGGVVVPVSRLGDDGCTQLMKDPEHRWDYRGSVNVSIAITGARKV